MNSDSHLSKDQWIQKAKALLFDLGFCSDALHKDIDALIDAGGGYDHEAETSDSPLNWPHPEAPGAELVEARRQIDWLRFGGPALDAKRHGKSEYWEAATLYENHLETVPPPEWELFGIEPLNLVPK
jgi:hypothetical protein